MRQRQLAMQLSSLPPHPMQNVALEQYSTDGDLAARWIAEIVASGDIDSTTRTLDLGAGNGILGLGLVLAGAAHTTLLDVDAKALQAAAEGADRLGLADQIEIIQEDVQNWQPWPPEIDVDLIVMNPPWGTQTPRADRIFLEVAFASTVEVIHLMHSKRAEHPLAMARDAGWGGELLFEDVFRLPATYVHHSQRAGKTDISCYRFVRC